MTAKRACLVLLLFGLPLFAQTPERELNAQDRKKLAELVPHLLETLYVLPDKGNELAALVRKSFESGGKYESATTASALAKAISADLAVANDRHLKMSWNANGAEEPVLTIEQWQARRAAMAAASGPRAPAGGGPDGVEKVEVLEGNIGYLRISEFTHPDRAKRAITGAMAKLENTDAIIVDVRNCPGGSGDTVAYLASYFFGPEPRVLMRRHHRPSNTTRDTAVVEVDGKRVPDVALFVLTGLTSASACESFAFQMQQWGRAMTVGEKTAGAGYNNMIVDLGAGLRFSISIGTALHGKTGKSFEGVGVQPDIAVPADRALETARDVAKVRKLEREWLDAYEKRDTEAMNRIVADDFVIVHSDGRKQTKPEIMAMLARPRPATMPSPKFTTEEVQARVDGDAVVLTGKVTMQMGSRTHVSRYSDLYAKRGGRWQVVASEQRD